MYNVDHLPIKKLPHTIILEESNFKFMYVREMMSGYVI